VPQTAPTEAQESARRGAQAISRLEKADNGPTDPSQTTDPDIVCVSFKEGLSEDWCYAACTNGICPPEAAGDCMCGKGAPKQQQQQASGQGKDWASGAVLPKAAEAPSAVAEAPSAAVAVPLPSLAAPTDPTCISIKTGTPDFWCQNSCGAQTNYCPEDTCKCGQGAVQESQAKASKAMDDWNEAERQNRVKSGEGDDEPAAPAQQAAAIPAAPGPATAQETATAADAWAAAAAQTPPEAVPAVPAAAAVSPPAQPILTGPEPTQPTDAWKAAAEAASKPVVAIPVADALASPVPVAPPALTPQAQKNIADRDAAMAARDAEIAGREQPEDWVAGAKEAMDKVMADRDAEIAARTDGTSVPLGAIPA